MNTLGAYILIHNEKDILQKCIDLLLPYVDELLLVNHGSTDGSFEIMKKYIKNPKVTLLELYYEEPVNMGLVRTLCYGAMKSDWILACDADEYYPQESMQKIREFIENPGEAISARVKYHNIAWRSGFKQANFDHAPDRIYKRDVIDKCEGILPLDMQFVKKEYLSAPNKKKGSIGVLEYDNEEDKSFEHPRQPILNVYYYHLARTRGYNFEYEKNSKYQKNMHPDWSEEECRKMARINHWTSGLYDIEKIDVPYYIPTQNIKNPKVSVIITNYNYNEYLPESVGSIKNQTYQAHEIIIVDDCSRVKPEIEGVKILQQKENRGVSECRNWGIYESTGDYYICLDADDVLEPNFIEETLKEMKGDIQIVYSNYKVFGESSYECNYGEFSREKLKEFQTIPSCCALIDRHCFELSGGYSNKDHWEDWGYWLKLSNLGFNFKRVDQFLFNYRRHAGSRIDLLDQNKEEKLKEFKKMHNL